MPEKKTPVVHDADDLIDIRGASRMLFVKDPTIRSWLTRGKLRRFKAGGRTLVRKSDLLLLIKEA
jgi:excisionase family DNA binding protein